MCGFDGTHAEGWREVARLCAGCSAEDWFGLDPVQACPPGVFGDGGGEFGCLVEGFAHGRGVLFRIEPLIVEKLCDRGVPVTVYDLPNARDEG